MKKRFSFIALICIALMLSALVSFDAHAQATETPTPTASETPTFIPAPTDTPVITDTPTATLVITDTPTLTPAPTDTLVITDTPTETPTLTPIPTDNIPPYHFDGTVTYGDYIQIILISLLCVAVGLFGVVGLVVDIIIKGKR